MADLELAPDAHALLDPIFTELQERLGENLHALAVYGSAVRGNWITDRSDLNLLIVLLEDTPEAHALVGEIMRGRKRVEPFVLGARGLDRSMLAFAIKFRSIRRHYCLLHGADPFSSWSVDDTHLRFLCEQAVRNLRLRLKYAFIISGHDEKRYAQVLMDAVPGLITDLSETLRGGGVDLPDEFEDRLPTFEQAFDNEASVVKDLLAIRNEGRAITLSEIPQLHARVFRLLTKALDWIEARWPNRKDVHSS